jgi:predicted TIM-barrel fold metal-dependent hydrolase
MIIDVHTHNSGSRDELLMDELRRNGIGAAIVSCLGKLEHWPSAQATRQFNDDARAFVASAPESLRWLAYLNPQNEDWPAELERCVQSGACGIKLWISLKDAGGCMDRTQAVVVEAARRRLPVLFHTYQRTDANEPGEITVEELGRLAQAVPSAVLIAAHAGGNWRQSAGILRGLSANVYADVSGGYPDAQMVRGLVDAIGAARVLWGSDAPGRTAASQLTKVTLAPISDEDKELILWKNASRVFGITPVAATEPSARPLSGLPGDGADHFCFCGRWPCFDMSDTTPAQLDEALEHAGVERACAADLGGIFSTDLQSANLRFLEAARACKRVTPLAALNPRVHSWRQILASLPADVRGGIVYPYLHDWKLSDPAHAEFFNRCAARGLALWINCMLGDHRFRHPALACRPVSSEELAQFAQAAPKNSYVLQGLGLGEIGAVLGQPATAQFRCEISRLTDFGGKYETAVAKFGTGPFVLGSEFPFRDLRSVRWTWQRI